MSRIIVIPTFLLSCAIGLVACDDAPDEGVALGLSPGETDEGGGDDLGVGEAGDGDGDGDTGEEPPSDTLRVVLGGDAGPFIDGALNGYAGGSMDGLVVSLHIDPVSSHYEWKRYHGGLKNEAVRDLAVDANGRICASGWTISVDLPVTPNAAQAAFGGGTRDLFVGCWDAAGAVQYSSYLGGKLAELNDSALSFSSIGTPIVTSATNSINFKTTAGSVQPVATAGNNGVAVQFSAAGAITWGSYLGGAGNDTIGIHSDVGSDGSLWMIGNSDSADFPVTDGSSLHAQDSAVARVSSDGTTLEMATLLGGTAADFGVVIAALPDGTAITCGHTYSEDFPVGNDAVQTTHGSQQAAANFDVVLSHLDTDGSVLAATYLGGAGFDACLFMDVDANGDVYVAGWTDDLEDFPLTTDSSVFGPWDPDNQQGFLAKLDPDFEWLEYAVRTTVTRAMDVLDDGRVVLLGPEDPGVATTPNAIPGETSNLLVVYEPDGVNAQYVGYVVGDGMFVEVLEAVALP